MCDAVDVKYVMLVLFAYFGLLHWITRDATLRAYCSATCVTLNTSHMLAICGACTVPQTEQATIAAAGHGLLLAHNCVEL